MSFTIELEADDDGLVAIKQVVGKPAPGIYRVNGHVYQGPGSAGDSIGVTAPYMHTNTSSIASRMAELNNS